MKKILKFNVIFLLCISIIQAAKVLVIVEANYYNYDISPEGYGLIDDYVALVRAKDGYDVELISDFQIPAGMKMVWQCNELWNLIADEYQDEEIEGAVLVGDLPIPIFYQHDDYIIVPIDYLYMDVCDERVGGAKYLKLFDLPNSPDIGVWNTNWYKVSGEWAVYFDWLRGPDAKYAGDGIADIWVSRVYPVGLDGLREDGALWGDFLEEYEILDNYFRRVIKRMAYRAEVPPRAMAIGYAYHGSTPSAADNLDYFFKFFADGPTEQLHHVLWPNNTPEVYQTQLQSGPYGGISWGAAGGVKFPDDCKITSTFPEYEGDTRGYEAACLFVHSGGNAHGWHDVHGIMNKSDTHGATGSILTCMPWTHQTGAQYPGFDDPPNNCAIDWFKTEESYFKVSTDFVEGMMGRPAQSDGKYNFVIHNTSSQAEFDAYAFIPDHGDEKLFDTVYVNIWVDGGAWFSNKNNDDDYNHTGWWLEIKEGSGEWINIWKDKSTATINDLNASGTNTITISITPYYWDEVPNEIVTCDAVRLERTSPSPQNWHEDNPEDMHKMQPDHYRTVRAFTSMRDDGGPSKTKFTIMHCCQPNNFLVRHNIGNMYALAHNGLISIGRPTTCQWPEYGILFEDLKNGASFGKAYLDFVNYEGFPDKGKKTLALLGAGTLKANAYLPYVDAASAVFSDDIHTKWSYWIARSAEVIDMELYYESGQDYDPELNIYAGTSIVVRPGAKGVTFCRGSKVNLKINPELISSE